MRKVYDRRAEWTPLPGTRIWQLTDAALHRQGCSVKDVKVIANEVLQARGYLVICCDEPRRLGDVLERIGRGVERLEEKTVIVAETDRNDALAQLDLVEKLGWGECWRGVGSGVKFFYRVIAE